MALVKLEVKQVADLVNDATKQILGETDVLAEDLSNVIDLGKAIENAECYSTITNNLLLKIGMSIYVNRPYKSNTPNVIRTNVEYGQLIAKTRGKLDRAMANQSWNLVDGASYDDNQYIESTTTTKIFSKRDAFEIRKSITDEQIKGAFKSAGELMDFVSMLFTMVYNSLEVKRDSLVMMTICNMIGEVANANKASQYINLRSLYNTLKGTSLTASNCIYDKDFLKFATGIIKKYSKLMTKYSVAYNVNGEETFTPKELQHIVLLDEFADNCFTFLSSDTFHDEFVSLPYHETVPYWQGTGDDIDELSKINIKTASGTDTTLSGIIGIIFDHDALGVTEDKPTVQTHYVKSAEFTNWWFKQKVGYFNDLNENAIVFTIA